MNNPKKILEQLQAALLEVGELQQEYDKATGKRTVLLVTENSNLITLADREQLRSYVSAFEESSNDGDVFLESLETGKGDWEICDSNSWEP